MKTRCGDSDSRPGGTASTRAILLGDLDLACGFIDPATIVTSWHRRLDHGYPTPWLGRDAVLDPIETTLRAAAVLSRGRFGAWKYEVSNQDHSFIQGVEAVNNIQHGTPEPTFGGSESG